MTELGEQMVRRADSEGLPRDHVLRTAAAEFELATEGYYSDPQTVPVAKFFGAWARARSIWCKYTGEPLV